MAAETTIPIRETVPDYPNSLRGKRLLGVDAYHFGHYWCGDRVEVFERRELLDATGGDAGVDVRYRRRAQIPVAGPNGEEPDGAEAGEANRRSAPDLGEYVTNVGAYLARRVDGEDPVYADDADEWEWVSSYARDRVGGRAATDADTPGRRYAAAADGRSSY